MQVVISYSPFSSCGRAGDRVTPRAGAPSKRSTSSYGVPQSRNVSSSSFSQPVRTPPPALSLSLLLLSLELHDRQLRICCSLHASSKAAAHACCGGAPAPLPRSATDRARHRSRRSLFCRRTAEPSHTAATMWPKHAEATSLPDINQPCCPRGFHVHASTVVPMCLHHAHLLPPERPAPLLRRVPRALIANQPKKGKHCPRRKMVAAQNLRSRD